MALTNPMPMGPWKVSICFTHHVAGMQAAAQIFSLCTVISGSGCSPSLLFADHCVRSGVLPGQAYGVYRQLPEHHGVWDGEHPLPEGGVWRVRIR